MVQLEVEVDNEWRPVVRYDTAHGFAHIDRFTRHGKVVKERLSLTYAETLTRAKRDIKQNWAVYREKFLRGRVVVTRTNRLMAEKNLDLIFEFEKYVLTHPETAARIPEEAIVVMQVEGDERFNQWTQRMGKHHAKKGHPLVCITVKKIGPVRSRIERLEIGRVAARAS